MDIMLIFVFVLAAFLGVGAFCEAARSSSD